MALLAALATSTINIMKHSWYIILVFILVGCDNFSRPKSYDMTDTTMVLLDTLSSTPIDSVSAEMPKQETQSTTEYKEQPFYHSYPQSDEYDEGYHKGYADGEEDGYTHSGYQATYDDSNDYGGSAANEYEKGYSEGYEAGYDDNVEYEDD